MNNFDLYITPDEYATAESNGISNDLMSNRVRRQGWSKRRAMTEPPRQPAPGRRCEWTETMKQNGIKYRTFWKRVNVCGWEPERAATTPPKKYSDEIQALREASGICYKTFRDRVYRGWDEYSAATAPLGTRKGKSPKLLYGKRYREGVRK